MTRCALLDKLGMTGCALLDKLGMTGCALLDKLGMTGAQPLVTLAFSFRESKSRQATPLPIPRGRVYTASGSSAASTTVACTVNVASVPAAYGS